MGTDNDGRVPVPAQRRLALVRLRLNAYHLPALLVKTHQAAVLILRIDDIGVRGINHRLKTIAENGNKPVAVGDAVNRGGTRGAAQGGVILRAAVDVIKREIVVGRDPVKLGNRQVGKKTPGGRAVKGFIQTAVRARAHMVAVFRVYPQGMMIHMLIKTGHFFPAFAAIPGDH